MKELRALRAFADLRLRKVMLSLLLTASCAVALQCASQAQLTTLHRFTRRDGGGSDGSGPLAGVIQATDGNFYGTTSAGGANDTGTIYRMTPDGTLTILYSFSALTVVQHVNNAGINADGASPNAGLVQGIDGLLYGTAQNGGANGWGTIFRITTGGFFELLHTFSGTDGSMPEAGLIQASDHLFYGTTALGGTDGFPGGRGTIFSLGAADRVVFGSLHSFNFADGAGPNAALVQASDGLLYGTTGFGGAHNKGTVFQAGTNGAWFSSLYSFSGADGDGPVGGLVQAREGDLYGTTVLGGSADIGTVFRITTSGLLTTMHSFSGTDGSYPDSTLLQASDGNLYGSTLESIFRITTGGALATVYTFTGQADGGNPLGGLIQASDGNLYGTTYGGGINNNGTVFSFALGVVAANITGSCEIKRGAFHKNPQTGRLEQLVKIHYKGNVLQAGAVTLTLDGLSSNALLFNKSGNALNGSPYITLDIGADGVLSPGERVSVLLEFKKLAEGPPTYVPQVMAGPGSR